MVEMQFLQEQKTVHATVHPEHRRSLPSMAPRYTTHMDVGNADFAGAKISRSS